MVVIPIEERIVKSGDDLSVQVEYYFGGGYNEFKVKILN
jgi:hypothetical protein